MLVLEMVLEMPQNRKTPGVPAPDSKKPTIIKCASFNLSFSTLEVVWNGVLPSELLTSYLENARRPL
jgi:hypothetical protein